MSASPRDQAVRLARRLLDLRRRHRTTAAALHLAERELQRRRGEMAARALEASAAAHDLADARSEAAALASQLRQLHAATAGTLRALLIQAISGGPIDPIHRATARAQQQAAALLSAYDAAHPAPATQPAET